ncbi:MAG: alkaline phosphatase family protein [Candidatus Marinimicrobia bacterium]|nr:alkaline phosphatase family protein [Candidatus Neomarinimicrobiota bacterium]
MRRLRSIILPFLLTAIVFTQADRPYVLLVSFDAFKPDYFNWTETPNFDHLVQQGVTAKSLQSIYPTKTFPNHYALATGMYAENHGLIANYFYDSKFDATYQIRDRSAVEDARWYGGEPIWVTAEKQGVKTASYFWVGSEAPVGGILPSISKRYEHEFPFEARVDSVLAWFQLPEEKRPQLILLYFHEPDAISHKYGPRGEETLAVVRELDALLGTLMEGLEGLDIYDQLNTIIVSDHGMAATSPQRTIDLAAYANMNGIIQENSGTFSSLYGGSPKKLKRVYKKLKKIPHISVYWKVDIPDRWHYKNHYRVKDILVVADDGWSILNINKPNKEYFRGGNHGYDNALWSMQAIFIADGPAFKDGYTRDTFENVNVYPIIAEILGIEPYPEIDGNVENVEDIFRPGN